MLNFLNLRALKILSSVEVYLFYKQVLSDLKKK